MELDFECTDLSIWKEALSSYKSRIQSLNKPNLISLDQFYTHELPSLLRQRNPNPFITTAELSRLMQWKLTRGKWRPRLLDFVSSLDDSSVQSVSQKAFLSLPDISKAISELTVLKGVGAATASAVLAAYAPETAPFMSDEELSSMGDSFRPSDVERALWSSAVGVKLQSSQTAPDKKIKGSNKRKRKH
ncbi:hypothetical protein ERO13_A02G079900v2 [Gossypium hirsutum]|uniref:Uncharacterized protein isoform X2 n=2 Tax=Gossypium TaxID=3633 RepID=A0ABM2ZBB6_GOSHI|nr:uncharacterized protein LOC107951137 isoform X2 [Gossypium hirsutum]KAG4211005.1 hypothetical protein ERO13_A02G079900v2 [Gossypium hirsutum]TYJ45959.1 hypothetical protein E1A91_A02G090600v1 [Gossypium mustelinum]